MTAIAGDITDTSVIVLVIVVNTVVGVVQEVRAEHAIAALRQLCAPTCRVVRDGRNQVVAAAEIVRGDIVPADIVFDDAHMHASMCTRHPYDANFRGATDRPIPGRRVPRTAPTALRRRSPVTKGGS